MASSPPREVSLAPLALFAGLNQYVFSIFTVTMGATAFLSLWHGEAEKVAATVGEAWIEGINAASESDEMDSNTA